MPQRAFSLVVVFLSFVFSAAQLSWKTVSVNAAEDLADIGTYINTMMEKYTRFYIGSQSKSFTAPAIKQLVEQG